MWPTTTDPALSCGKSDDGFIDISEFRDFLRTDNSAQEGSMTLEFACSTCVSRQRSVLRT